MEVIPGEAFKVYAGPSTKHGGVEIPSRESWHSLINKESLGSIETKSRLLFCINVSFKFNFLNLIVRGSKCLKNLICVPELFVGPDHKK